MKAVSLCFTFVHSLSSSLLKRYLLTLITALLTAWAAVANAQSQCTAVMQQAIALVSETCAQTGRNQACHGYFRVEVKPQDGAPFFPFAVGDIASVLNIQSLTSAPLDETANEWGVALLRLQANLPDALPGTNVTFLLLGDTTIEDEGTDENLNPMQVFRLQSGVAGVACSEAPADGLVIQSPAGERTVKLSINGVSIDTAGTAFVQAQPGEIMTVTALEGRVSVTLDDQTQMLEAGTSVSIPMSESLEPAGPVSTPSAITLNEVPPLPSAVLPRPISVSNPALPELNSASAAAQATVIAAQVGGDPTLVAVAIQTLSANPDRSVATAIAAIPTSPPLLDATATAPAVDPAANPQTVVQQLPQQLLIISLALLGVLVLLIVIVLLARNIYARLRRDK